MQVFRSPFFATLAGILFLAASAYFIATHETKEEIVKTSEARDLPIDFKLLRLDGKIEGYGDWKGKPLLINFWASWCGPCMQEMPDLYQVQKKYAARGLRVIAISLDENVQDGTNILIKRFGVPPFSIYQGKEEDLAKFFELPGVPYTIIVNREGKITYTATGARNWLSSNASEIIEAAL